MIGARTPIGIGWRPELALAIDRYEPLGFVEILAEDFDPDRPIPAPIARLMERGVVVIPHGIGLSLGGAERVDRRRLDHLARLAERFRSPLVSEHVAFVRAGGREAGHLLPVPRTRESLDILVENIGEARASLPVPLAVENIAALFDWPDAEFTEAEFLRELLDRTGVALLLDLANVHANARNRGVDARCVLDTMPIDRIAYCHVAGGHEESGLYHDTHAHPTPGAVLELVRDLAGRVDPPGVMLERDDSYPAEAELHRELGDIATALRAGAERRATSHAGVG